MKKAMSAKQIKRLAGKEAENIFSPKKNKSEKSTENHIKEDSEHFQYASNNITTLQNVYVPQSESVVNLNMDLRNEIVSLKNEVMDLKKEVNEMKEGNNRNFLKITEEVVAVKLESRKHHGESLTIDELNDTEKLPFNNINDLNNFDSLVQDNEEKLKQFKEFIAKTGGEGPPQFLRAAEKCFLITTIKNICHLKYKSTDKDMNGIL